MDDGVKLGTAWMGKEQHLHKGYIGGEEIYARLEKNNVNDGACDSVQFAPLFFVYILDDKIELEKTIAIPFCGEYDDNNQVQFVIPYPIFEDDSRNEMNARSQQRNDSHTTIIYECTLIGGMIGNLSDIIDTSDEYQYFHGGI